MTDLSVAVDVLDEMIATAAKTASSILDAEGAWRELAQHQEVRRSLEAGVNYRIWILRGARRAIIDAGITAHEASASDDQQGDAA